MLPCLQQAKPKPKHVVFVFALELHTVVDCARPKSSRKTTAIEIDFTAIYNNLRVCLPSKTDDAADAFTKSSTDLRRGVS
jgi:hypothetical protein